MVLWLLSRVKHKRLYTQSWLWFCLQRPYVHSHGSQKPDPHGKLIAHREVELVSGWTLDCMWDHILWSPCLGSWIGTRNLFSEKATLGWGEESGLTKSRGVQCWSVCPRSGHAWALSKTQLVCLILALPALKRDPLRKYIFSETICIIM